MHGQRALETPLRGMLAAVLFVPALILLIARDTAGWFFNQFLLGRSVKLVPGGVIIERSPVWQHRRRGWYATREDTSLLGGTAEFHNTWQFQFAGRNFSFDSERFLAAWLSGARTPTPAEVQGLLGDQSQVITNQNLSGNGPDGRDA